MYRENINVLLQNDTFYKKKYSIKKDLTETYFLLEAYYRIVSIL